MQNNNIIMRNLMRQGIILLCLLFASSIFASVSFAADDSDATMDAIQYRIKGYTYQRQGNYTKAIENYKKAIDSSPFYSCAHNDLGVLYEQLGKPDKAEEYYLNAIKADQNYSSAYSNIALLYERQNKLEQACYYWGMRAQMGEPNDQWTTLAKNKYAGLSVVIAEQQRTKRFAVRKKSIAKPGVSEEDMEMAEADNFAKKFAVNKKAENKRIQKELKEKEKENMSLEEKYQAKMQAEQDHRAKEEAAQKKRELKEKQRLQKEQERYESHVENNERRAKSQSQMQQEQQRLKREQERQAKKAKEEQANFEKKKVRDEERKKVEDEQEKARRERLENKRKLQKENAPPPEFKTDKQLKEDAGRLQAYQEAKEKEIQAKRDFVQKAEREKKQRKIKALLDNAEDYLADNRYEHALKKYYEIEKLDPEYPNLKNLIKDAQEGKAKAKLSKEEQKKLRQQQKISAQADSVKPVVVTNIKAPAPVVKKEAPVKKVTPVKKVEPVKKEESKKADQHFTKGQNLYLSNRYQEAAKEFEATLAINPNYAEASKMIRYCQRRTQTGYYRPLEESIVETKPSSPVKPMQEIMPVSTYKEPVMESPEAIEKRVSQEVKQEGKTQSDMTAADIEKKYQVIGVVAYRSETNNMSVLNDELLKKAKDMGADEVIQVRYFQNNNYVYGYGTAVKKRK